MKWHSPPIIHITPEVEMTGPALLLIILTIFALLGGIAAEISNRNNPMIWSLIFFLICKLSM